MVITSLFVRPVVTALHTFLYGVFCDIKRRHLNRDRRKTDIRTEPCNYKHQEAAVCKPDDASEGAMGEASHLRKKETLVRHLEITNKQAHKQVNTLNNKCL